MDTSGGTAYTFGFGNTSGDLPVAGDWNADGSDTIGVFRGDSANWYLSNGYTGAVDLQFNYGLAGDKPIVGDWNGDGIDTPGVFRNGAWYLSNSFGGTGDYVFGFGQAGDIPVAGDWDGDNRDSIGVMRGDHWYLSNGFSGSVDYSFAYGISGDQPVIGDWDANNTDTVGVVRSGTWYLSNSFGGNGDYVFGYGNPGDQPVAGDWDGSAPPPPPPPPPPPSGAITLTRTADGVSIYQNRQGTYYISDSCHTNGTSTDPGKTIGPGYIYRVDLNGREVVAPLASAGPVLNPLSGIGVFAVDMYQGDPNNTPYTDNNGVFHPGAGSFEALHGNVCLGDNDNIAYTAGSGVSSSTTDDRGTATSAPDGSYLWVWYTVTLSDPYGKQFAVSYRYRFYANEVRLLTKVKPCPDGVCYRDPRGPAPFLKMPKFQYTVSGPEMDYQAQTCYDASGGVIQDAQQLDYPGGSTVNNHCNGNTRDRIDIRASSSGLPPFRITAKSQPVAAWGFEQPFYPWESAATTYGLDNWAKVGQNRQHLTYSATLNTDNSCGIPYGTRPDSWMDVMRRWEMGGDNPSATWAPNLRHYYPYKTIYAMFKGWEDGNGPPDCRSLYNSMVSNEAYANFFVLRNG